MSQPAFIGHLNPEDPELNDRQRRVFAALVTLYGQTARPVGSEMMARESGIPLSSASIRSALAELESLGLLERSHLAAGRMPSDRGYEFFVRALLTPAALSPELVLEVDRRLLASTRDVEHLLGEASRLLSSFTRQLGLAHSSSLDHERLSALDLEPLGERRALMVLGLGAGAVRTLVLELESPLDPEALAEVCAVLRERLLGRWLAEVRDRLGADPELVRSTAVRLVAMAAAESWSQPSNSLQFSAGVRHIAEQPEFAGSKQLAPILRVVEIGEPINRLMVESLEGRVAVRVGLDEDRALAGCSLVTYPLPGALRAAVGVLGPRRMDYAHALAVVDAVGSRVAELLQA